MRPKSSLLGVIWVPCDFLFLLPVEEKAIAGLSGNARNGFFPLPVEEKALSGSPRRPKSGPLLMMDASFDPLRLHFPPPCQGKM